MYDYVIGINQATEASFSRSYQGDFTWEEWALERLNSLGDQVAAWDIRFGSALYFEDEAKTKLLEVCWLISRTTVSPDELQLREDLIHNDYFKAYSESYFDSYVREYNKAYFKEYFDSYFEENNK